MLLFSLIIVFLLITIYCIYLLKNHSKSIPFMVLFLVYYFWCFASIVYIDNGTYIGEQNNYSHYTGASFRFIIITLPFFIGAPIFFSRNIKNKNLIHSKLIFFKIKTSQLSLISLLFSLSLCGYLILDEIISGIPLLSKEITQFNFYSHYSKLPLAEFLSGLFLGYMLLVCGVFFVEQKKIKYKLLFLSVYFLAILYRLLLGEKFYPFLLYTIEFFIPTLILNFDVSYKSIVSILKKNAKWIKRMILFVLILLVIVYYKYSQEQSATYGDPLNHLISRIFALQSHTYWGFDNYLMNNKAGFDLGRSINEVTSGFQGVDKLDPSYGLARIMYIVSPQSIVDMYLSKSTRFYGGYWTIAIGCFGYLLTSVYSLFMAVLFSFISSILYSTIKNKEFLIMFIAFNAYFNFFKYFNEGDFIFLLSKRMILAVVVLIFYRIIKKISYNKTMF